MKKENRFYFFINIFSLFIINLKRNWLKIGFLSSSLFFLSFFLILSTNLSFSLKNLLEEFSQSQLPLFDVYIEANNINSNLNSNLIDELKSFNTVEAVVPILRWDIPFLLLFELPIPALKGKLMQMPISVLGIPEDSLDFFFLKKTQDQKNLYEKFLKSFKGFKKNQNETPFLIPYLAYGIVNDFLKSYSMDLKNPFQIFQLVNYNLFFNYSLLGKQKNLASFILRDLKPVGFLKENFPFMSSIVLPASEMLSILEKNLRFDEKTNINHLRFAQVYYIKKKPRYSDAIFQSQIQDLRKKYSLNILKNSPYKKIETYFQNILYFVDFFIYTVFILFLFLISMTLLYGISYFFEQRKKEIQLYQFWGASWYSIFSLLFLEYLFFSSLAIGFAYILSIFVFNFYLTDKIIQIIQSTFETIPQFFIKKDIKALFIFQYQDSFLKLILIWGISNFFTLMMLISSIYKSSLNKTRKLF